MNNSILASPGLAQRHPDIGRLAQQDSLAILARAQPPGDGLRRHVHIVDAMDDFVDLEGGKHPIDRRPRRFYRITLAAAFRGDAPTDLETRPLRRRKWPD